MTLSYTISNTRMNRNINIPNLPKRCIWLNILIFEELVCLDEPVKPGHGVHHEPEVPDLAALLEQGDQLVLVHVLWDFATENLGNGMILIVFDVDNYRNAMSISLEKYPPEGRLRWWIKDIFSIHLVR